jgi:subtilisin family serine protease
MPTPGSRLPALLIVAVVSVFVGAGSVVAAMPRPAVTSALADYSFDTPALQQQDLDRAVAGGGASPDRVVVVYTGGFADATTMARVRELIRGTPLSGDGVIGREVFRVPNGDAAAAAQRLRGLAGVTEARVERTVSLDAGHTEAPVPLPQAATLGAPPAAATAVATTDGSGLPLTPNDPYAQYAWGIPKVGANQAWGTSTGSGVKVAVLDCGIHGTHPDLVGQVILEKNFSASATVDDRCNHGTHVAGTIAALTNNGVGVPSVAPGARLLNGKVLSDAGNGTFTDFENGLRWAADNGARVVNLSLGADIPCPASTQAAVNYARSKGVVVVAAAGNSGLSHAAAPANCSGVVAVGASDQGDVRASFSNTGTGVAVAAPGVGIGSTVNPDVNGGVLYASGSGTSMAAPHAAGVVALLWTSRYGTSVDAVIDRLESTAVHIAGTGSLWTYGRISAFDAVGLPAPIETATSIPSPTAMATATRAPATATAVPTKAPGATATPTKAPAATAVPTKASAATAVLPKAPVATTVPPKAPVATSVPTKAPAATAVPTRIPAATAVPTRVPTATPTRVPPATPTRVPPATATPAPRKPTAAPTGVTAVTLGARKVLVTWKATVDTRTTFNIYRGDATGQNMTILVAGLPSATTWFQDPAAPAGAPATYQVAEQNAAGEGPHSTTARTPSSG